MLKRIRRIFLKRFPEADLNQEAINAAGFYVENAGEMPLVDRQHMLNYVAHGYYMGVRKFEEKLGIKRSKNDVGR